jgi:hypothetical protein
MSDVDHRVKSLPPSSKASIKGIDLQILKELSGFADQSDLQGAHRERVEQGMEDGLRARDEYWSEAIAVGSLAFIDKVKSELAFKAAHRDVTEPNGSYALREAAEGYASNITGEREALRSQNTFFWNESIDESTACSVRARSTDGR